MAFRSILKKATINCRRLANPFLATTTTTRNLSTDFAVCVNNRGDHRIIRRPQHFGPIREPQPQDLPQHLFYRQLLAATEGFGIDFDLGDFPHIIRPYSGSLDDPQITNRARFAVDNYNKRKDKHLQFVKVVKANRRCDAYYLTLDAIDDTGKRMRYLALVDGDEKMHLLIFDLFGDADNPPPYYLKKGETVYPRDYFKYCKQVHDSEGFYVDDGITDCIKGIFPVEEPLDDPMLLALAHFAVNEYNRKENAQLQFMRVVRANKLDVGSRRCYLTLELDDAGERKLYLAKVSGTGKMMHLLLFRCVDDAARTVKL